MEKEGKNPQGGGGTKRPKLEKGKSGQQQPGEMPKMSDQDERVPPYGDELRTSSGPDSSQEKEPRRVRQRGKKRRKRQLREESRCAERLKGGRRCEAARVHGSRYCVFHDPEKREQRSRASEGLPYEHADEVQRLLAEAVEAVKKKRLSPRAGNTLGYLATLLLHNQTRLVKERERRERDEFWSEAMAGARELLSGEEETPQESGEEEGHEVGDG